MQKKLIISFIALCLGFTDAMATGPDIHFSQYNASPLNLNPALAGMNSCRYRVNANVKMQYAGAAANMPFVYNTGGVGFDISMGHGYKFKNFGGFGLNYYSDFAGELLFTTHKAELTFAYHILLNKYGTQTLSLAATGGLGFHSLNSSKATFNDQYIDGVYNPNGPREVFDRNKFIYGDIGAGALWSMTSKNMKNNYFLGLATTHLNQPKLAFYRDNPERLYLKLTFHGGASIKVKGKFSMLPSFMYLHQGSSNEFNFGTYVRYQLGYLPSDKTAVYLGAWGRVNNQFDAFIIAARFDIKGVNIGFSYDVNLSKFSPGTGTVGGPELSILYNGCFKKGNKVILCPVL